MRDVLVVYYSRSGTTDVVARALATALGADLDRITPAVSYAGAAGFVRGLWHALRRIGPPIRKRFDPAPFKTVVLCSPVWAGRLPGPHAPPGRSGGLRLAWVWTLVRTYDRSRWANRTHFPG